MWELFDTSKFVTRGQCGNWSSELADLAQISDSMIAVAYIMIPVSLLWLYRMRGGAVRSACMLLAFAAFIWLCGLTHICQVLAFHWPAYRFFTFVSFLTGLVSLGTAVALPWMVHRMGREPIMRAIVRDWSDITKDVSRLELELEVQKRLKEEIRLELAAEHSKVAALEESVRRINEGARDAQDQALRGAVEATRQLRGGQKQ